MQKVFNDYVKNFDQEDELIKRKIKHSLRVMSVSEILAKEMDYSKRETYLAKVLGLFHDIGRFRQAKEYHTYDDLKSIDHGDLGYQIFLKEIVPHLDLTTDEVKDISMAIKYHNKYSINDLNKEFIKSTKFIRDTDKIDILYIIANDKKFFKINKEDQISPKVKEDFFKHKAIDNHDIKNDKDRIINILAFVWDINYKQSAKIIKDNRYYNIIQKTVNDENLNEYFEEIYKFLQEV